MYPFEPHSTYGNISSLLTFADTLLYMTKSETNPPVWLSEIQGDGEAERDELTAKSAVTQFWMSRNGDVYYMVPNFGANVSLPSSFNKL